MRAGEFVRAVARVECADFGLWQRTARGVRGAEVARLVLARASAVRQAVQRKLHFRESVRVHAAGVEF